MSGSVDIQKLEQQAARYILSMNDFEEALSYLYERPAVKAVNIRRALLSAAIVAYARPFSSNEKGRASQATAMVALKPQKLFAAEQLSLHRNLLRFRNEAIAHSTSKVRPVIHKVLPEKGAIHGYSSFDVMTQSIDRQMFASLCKILRSASFEQLREINNRIRKVRDAT